MTPVLSVLIVTWNCRQLIGPCLDHLFASHLCIPFEVIVVDNQSQDGTAAAVRSRVEPITVLEPGTNLGFGRGNNLAARHARGKYLLLLNPDAYLTEPTAVSQLLETLATDSQQDLAAVGPRLNNPDGSHQIGDAGFAPTLGNIVRHVTLVSRLLPGTHGFYVNHPTAMRRECIAVDWLAATCLLIKRGAYDAVGGFDPRFFMYGEDVDLGDRLTRAGYSLALLPGVPVVHLQGATQRSDPDAIHISTGWIDAIFALHQGSRRLDTIRRWAIAGTMLLGYAARGLAYAASGRRPRARAMLCYARYGWGSRSRRTEHAPDLF